MRKFWIAGLVCSFFFTSASGWTARTEADVAKLKKALTWLNKRLEKAEKKLAAKGGGGSESADGAVNLDDLSLDSAPGGSSHGSHGGASMPEFKAYFDLWFYNRPSYKPMTFGAVHYLFLVDIIPAPGTKFSFEVNPSPRFFELSHDFSEKLQVRAGKIFIPFDESYPHTLYGGRMNVQTLNPGNETFLPNIWAELGVAARYRFIDSKEMQLEAHLAITNGFGQGNSDPKLGASAYPDFTDTGVGVATEDNNAAKALTARVKTLWDGKFSLGASTYINRWNNASDTEGLNMFFVGIDAGIRLPRIDLKGGFMAGSVKLPTDSMTRGGYFIEGGYRFGTDLKWKGIARFGGLSVDSRVLSGSDVTTATGAIMYSPLPFQISLEHSHDFLRRANKNFNDITIVRLMMIL